MNNNTLTIKIERAISELRRGGKLVISDNNSGVSVLLVASEMIQNDTIEEMSNLAFSSRKCGGIQLSGRRKRVCWMSELL